MSILALHLKHILINVCVEIFFIDYPSVKFLNSMHTLKGNKDCK